MDWKADFVSNLQRRIMTLSGYGFDTILFDPKRLSRYLKREGLPKLEKKVLVKCAKHKIPQILKDAAEPDRLDIKEKLSQRLHEKERFDLDLCREALDILAKVLFYETPRTLDPEFIKARAKKLMEESEDLQYKILYGESRPEPVRAAATKFYRIRGGTFQKVSDNGEVRTVTISSFIMAEYPVTQREWRIVMGDNPSHFTGDNLPVENVNFFKAAEYCNRLSQMHELAPAYTVNMADIKVTWNSSANGYRLPTEAEWEYAARGGNGSPGDFKYAGSNNADEVAWHSGNSGGQTQPVGTKKANGLGLYDMSGNVWEWCWDSKYDEYRNTAEGIPSRVVRGGSWDSGARDLRSAFDNNNPFLNSKEIGFRLVRADNG
ncbi:MAG: formylglycine-generating enzyme family protein [Treponema sp.]|jgi:formylglycine-generating enzyme required for sulfatase activity|nr:formylglycine-generating enzyme family protein [Treponema sp.]